MRILILTASAGNGHNSAAKRIKETFLNHNSNNEVKIVDGFKEFGNPLKNWIQTTGYLLICNHFVSIYNYFFKKSEINNFSHPEKRIVNRSTKSLQKKMLKEILDFKPDLIISTYIYCAVALCNVLKKHNLNIKTAAVTLDYGISPYWECIADRTDYMFLTNDKMIQPFIERGFNKDKLFPTGIPVANAFSNPFEKEKAREQLNLDKDLFTLIIMKSGFFTIKEKDIIKNLSKVNTKIQVIIVNGKSTKSKNKIDKLIKKYNIKHKILNLGFVHNIPLYFSACDLLIGKAGGLTTTEAITIGIPSLIVNKLPQQEIYNKRFMVDNGCAIEVNKTNIAEKINMLLSNPQKLINMKENCLNIRITNSCEKMYDILKDIK